MNFQNRNRNEKEEIVTLFDDDGNEVQHQILFTFHSDEYNKNYIFLFPVSENDSDEVDVNAFIVENSTLESAEGELQPIEDDQEWEMAEKTLNAFLDEENSK